MKELSLNILDIACNSVKAGAKNIRITVTEEGRTLEITISDDGCGMPPETVATVTDPFTTSRTTRKVGMGLPLFKLAAEQTGGNISVESRWEKDFPENHGTTVYALFYRDHIDFPPLGDMVSTVVTLIQGSPDRDFHYEHDFDGGQVVLDTTEIRNALGEGVPLSSPEIVSWIADYLKEQYAVYNNKNKQD